MSQIKERILKLSEFDEKYIQDFMMGTATPRDISCAVAEYGRLEPILEQLAELLQDIQDNTHDSIVVWGSERAMRKLDERIERAMKKLEGRDEA
jgi:hypothetical protein